MGSTWIFLTVRRFCEASRLPPGTSGGADIGAHGCWKEYFVAGDSRYLAIRSGRNQAAERANSFCTPGPYLPMGTVAAALLYPGGHSKRVSTKRLATVLTQVGFGVFVNELQAIQDWSKQLSPGEQQRFAFARIILLKPALLFLAEASSALDESSESQLYCLLRTASWRPAIVSVDHRGTLRSFHDQLLEISAFKRNVAVRVAWSMSANRGIYRHPKRHRSFVVHRSGAAVRLTREGQPIPRTESARISHHSPHDVLDGQDLNQNRIHSDKRGSSGHRSGSSERKAFKKRPAYGCRQ